MPMNLSEHRWVPVRRTTEDGAARVIAPWQLTDAIDTNPIVALDAPRPDFNGALVQFLIGLLQTAFAPGDADEWFEHFEQPPTPDTLRKAFAPYAHAFELDGDGPRFMQDTDPLNDQKPLPITALLIDTAGSETHFVKDLPGQGLSPSAAAMALYALQTNAPSGGVGHRTSLRGGGPLTTLVVAAPEQEAPATLWQTLWLNVLDQETLGYGASPDDAERIFPWLCPTRTSEKGKPGTTPEAVHRLQAFWGMPRRIRLDLEAGKPGRCAITGAEAPALIARYRTRNYGTNYTGAWQHPLSPYTHNGKDLLAMHPRGSINYRHWLSLVQEGGDNKVKRLPAAVIKRFTHTDYELDREGWRFQVWAFGYDMDNMKPRCWYESTLPLFQIRKADKRKAVENAAQTMVNAAGLFLDNLRGAIKDAWFEQRDPRRKSAKLDHVQDAFWQQTETPFYARIRAILNAEDTATAKFEAYQAWHADLRDYTQRAFDHWVDYNQITEQSHPRRIAEARRNLRRFNYKKKIKDLLEIPDRQRPPETAAA